MKYIDDPFENYPEEFKPPISDDKKEEIREKRRAYRAKKLGRPIGKHGGYRKGAGRKRIREWTHRAYLNLDRIQVKLLEDLGNGDLSNGVQVLIERNLND